MLLHSRLCCCYSITKTMQPSAAASRGGRRMLCVLLTTQTFYLSKLLRNGRETRDPHLEAVTVQRLLRTVKKLQNQFDKGLKGAAEKSRAVHGGPVSWVSLALLVVTGIGLLLYWDQEKKWQLKAPIEALLQIAHTSCLLYMGVELRCIWSEGEC